MKNLSLDFYNPDLKIFILLLIIAIVLFISFRKSGNKKAAKLIFSLRLFILILSAVLLTNPLINWDKEIIHNPIVELWIDNSQSLSKDQTFDKTEYQNSIKKISEQLNQQQIEVHLKSFDRDINEIQDVSDLTFDGASTNISQLFHENDEIDGAVIITDGQYNSGENPYSMDYKNNFPVFCIGIGDTSKRNDAKVVRLNAPLKVKMKDEFTISAELDLANENDRYTVSLLKNQEIVKTKVIHSEESDFLKYVDFKVIASDIGENEYSIILENNNDSNPTNNKKTCSVNVLPGEKKVLIVCTTPSFDTRSIMNIFQSYHKDFSTKIIYLKNNQWFPGNIISDEEFDFVIYVDFPQKNMNREVVSAIKKLSDIPSIHYINRDINIEILNALFGKRIIEKYTYKPNKIIVDENRFGTGNPVVRDIDQKTDWQALPPILYDFNELQLSPLFQSILEVSDGKNQPVYAISKDISTAFFIGVDFWRWQNMTESKNYSQLLINTVKYLLEKDLNNQVQMTTDKSLYLRGESMELSGMIYDLNGESLPTSDVHVNIMKDGKILDDFYMSWQNNRFFGKYSFREAGDYQIAVKALKDDALIGEKIKDIHVVDRVLEFLEIGQNRELLNFIANENGGELVGFQDIEKMVGTIKSKPDITTENREIEFNKSKSIFFLIIIVLVGEWVIRKYFGYL